MGVDTTSKSTRLAISGARFSFWPVAPAGYFFRWVTINIKPRVKAPDKNPSLKIKK